MIVLTDFASAMLKHPNYDAELTEIETLGADWFPEELI